MREQSAAAHGGRSSPSEKGGPAHAALPRRPYVTSVVGGSAPDLRGGAREDAAMRQRVSSPRSWAGPRSWTSSARRSREWPPGAPPPCSWPATPASARPAWWTSSAIGPGPAARSSRPACASRSTAAACPTDRSSASSATSSASRATRRLPTPRPDGVRAGSRPGRRGGAAGAYPAARSVADELAKTRLLRVGPRRAVTALAERSPVVLVVEDLHWADSASAELLGFLTRNLDASRVLADRHVPQRRARPRPSAPPVAERAEPPSAA